MIQIEALSVKYPGRKQAVLRELSLQVRKGETLLILGPSGSGKSSLALTFNGLIPHSIGEIVAGSVRVNRRDTRTQPVAELAQQVGILFQDPDSQFATLKVEDEIVFGLENLGVDPATMDANVDAALEQVGMAHARQRSVFALSGGEKQRVALAALLAMRPHMLVFDEPTANLDSIGTRQVFALLAQLKARQQHTLVLIEHKLDELMHLIDRVVVLDLDGRIFADGDARTVFDQNGAELKRLGVWMPQVSLLAHELRQAGVKLSTFPITLEEAVKVVEPLLATNPFAPVSPGRPTETHADSVLAVRDLSFAYGWVPALHHVSLNVERGDFLAIVGPNGAGKSTLARHLIGLLPAPSNSVFLEGKDLAHYSTQEIARKVAYVFQNPEHQFVTERVFDEVAYGLRAAGLAEAEVQARSAELLDRFGLGRYAKANPFTLSHGEKRRLSVAAMLAMGEDILILDEPTFGQDERNAATLVDMLDDLNAQGKTIVIITHDMRLVAEHARSVLVMMEGRVVFFGEPRQLFRQPELMAQAHLDLPPLARLAARLSTRYPQVQEWATLDDFRRLGIESMQRVGT